MTSAGRRLVANLANVTEEETMRFLFVVTLVAALGSGLMAGLFFAFSAAVMKALARLQPPQGIAAMQSINVTVINPLFLTVFLGTAVACATAAVFSLLKWDSPGAAYRLVGSLVYLSGALLVTIVCNVPRNDALASVDPPSAAGASLWAGFLTAWTAWNHVRTAASFVAAALLTIGLVADGWQPVCN